MLAVTKPVGLFLDRLDLGIQPFSDSVGNSVSKIGKNLLQVLTKHPCLLYHGLKPRMRAQ